MTQTMMLVVKKCKLATGVTAADILRSPGVVSLVDHTVEAASSWPSIQEALTKATAAFDKSRTREGAHLKKDMMARLRTLKGLLKQISYSAMA